MRAIGIGSALAIAGRNGPAVLCGGVAIGLVAPPLAELAKPALGFSVFLFTLAAFLKVDAAAFRREVTCEPVIVGLVMLWVLVGVPAAIIPLAALVDDPALSTGLVLNMIAPPLASAAAVAAMLGLSPSLALLASILGTAAAPFLLPVLAFVATGEALDVDPWRMSVRLLLIVGGAFVASLGVRRVRPRLTAEHPHAITGLAVVGLILVAIGAMHGMRDLILAEPERALAFLFVAFAVNGAFQVLGTLLVVARFDRRRALTVGLLSGNRAVTLLWAALAVDLVRYPAVELYLAMSVFPIFILPLLTQPVITRLLTAPARPAALQGAGAGDLSTAEAGDARG